MTTRANKIDVAIIGGGIVGLWTAKTLLEKSPHLTVVVFEAENYLGEHTSGRNSEVLHSGLYYSTDSLKHRMCLEGNVLWRDYVKKKSLPFLDCGKFIVGLDHQNEKVEELFERAKINEVVGVRPLTLADKSKLNDHVHFQSGFFISSSAVLNVSESLKSLRHDIESLGGIVLVKNKASLKDFSAEHFVLEVGEDLIESAVLINTAGLFAVEFRRAMGLVDYENYFVKGNYLKLKKKLPIEHLVYPIPPASGLGLGVHLTLDTAGDQKFGPNTEEVRGIDYAVNLSLVDQMVPEIQQIFKNINKMDLQLAYAGVRPKVKKQGKLVTDFIFQSPKDHGIKGYFECLGIESPGVTAAPRLAQLLCNAL